MAYEDYYKNVMQEQFGRRRGRLYRSEREWFALTPDKNVNERLKNAAEQVKAEREGLKDEQGYSRSRTWRFMGGIPDFIVYSNPELLYDPEAAKQFFRDFPEFSSKK